MTRLTQEYVRSIFDYDASAGRLVWKEKRGCHVANRYAGCLHWSGYRVMGIDGVQYREHQVIWLWHFGEWSTRTHPLDHINGDRADNRIENLRRVSFAANCSNRHKARRASGEMCIKEKNGRYEVAIGCRSSYRYVGVFYSLDDARAARDAARSQRLAERLAS